MKIIDVEISGRIKVAIVEQKLLVAPHNGRATADKGDVMVWLDPEDKKLLAVFDRAEFEKRFGGIDGHSKSGSTRRKGKGKVEGEGVSSPEVHGGGTAGA